ncbi:MAG: acetyl-CoA carboxylase biotin carboxyl carrier protein [Candidatus Omnitrophica bacterium]|nr:acetyl-CoA carboxylase biotin carboxyl carrier protein [Candidatus Omnitrophota bacterium]
MNIKEIKELVHLMNENNLTDLEIEKEGMRIHLAKTQKSPETLGGPVIVERHPAPQVSPGGSPAEPVSQQKPSAKTAEVMAPMVGTFYRAPSPEAAAFVEVGKVIEPGQVICIIEAMKLMNEIKSEVKGKILEILVDNAEPVEFGQPMFLIEPL